MTTSTQYYYGTGKRKSAIARVRLYPGGDGQVEVNGKPLEQILSWMAWRTRALRPFAAVPSVSNNFNVTVQVRGGGIAAWSDAICHGISRALVVSDPSLKPELRKHGLLTRDSRIKERKKYGLKRARRAPQYTKR